MAVADCHCESVGGVVGFRDFFKVQHYSCHFLNLFFLRPAVADNTLFNLKRRVFENRNILLLGGEDDYSPCLSYIYGGFLVCVEKQFFDSERFGFLAFKKDAHFVVNMENA